MADPRSTQSQRPLPQPPAGGAAGAGGGAARTRRRVLRAALGGGAGGAGLLLAACGQAATSSQGAPQGTGGGAGVKGTVLFWQWGAGYVDGFSVLVDEFNAAKTGVTLNFDPGVVSTSTTSYWDKLTAALAGNVGPDVFLMNTNARTWANQGLLRPLDDLLKKDKTAQDQNQSALKAFREWYDVGGKQMGWAWDYSTIVTAFNVAHLREAGLTPRRSWPTSGTGTPTATTPRS